MVKCTPIKIILILNIILSSQISINEFYGSMRKTNLRFCIKNTKINFWNQKKIIVILKHHLLLYDIKIYSITVLTWLLLFVFKESNKLVIKQPCDVGKYGIRKQLRV